MCHISIIMVYIQSVSLLVYSILLFPVSVTSPVWFYLTYSIYVMFGVLSYYKNTVSIALQDECTFIFKVEQEHRKYAKENRAD